MTPQSKPIPIIEIFGPVIQGEGIMAGHQTMFIRTGGCDFRCVWCDTPEAVIPEQVSVNKTMMTTFDIMDKIREIGPYTKWVTISGGNPAIHDMGELVHALHVSGRLVAVETQGTIYRSWFDIVDVMTISPKPPSSGMKVSWDKTQDFIVRSMTRGNGGKTCIKVVVFDEDDFTFAHDLRMLFLLNEDFYVQPGTIRPEDVAADVDPRLAMNYLRGAILDKTRWLTERVLSTPDMAGVKVMPQLHALMYGWRRGV